MPLKMLVSFKQYKEGQIVNPEADLADWLISRKYAVAAAAGPESEAAAAVLPAAKKARK